MKPKLFNKEENPVEKIEQEIHSQRIRSHTNPISKALTKAKDSLILYIKLTIGSGVEVGVRNAYIWGDNIYIISLIISEHSTYSK